MWVGVCHANYYGSLNTEITIDIDDHFVGTQSITGQTRFHLRIRTGCPRKSYPCFNQIYQ